MKLNIIFGNNCTKIVNWGSKLEEFPRIISCGGKKWEWVMYQEVKDADYELMYSEIRIYDPNYHVTNVPVFEEIFELGVKCECGAAYSSFSWDHMRWCPKHTKW